MAGISKSILQATVLSSDSRTERIWLERLQSVAPGYFDLQFRCAHEVESAGDYGQIVFLDSEISDFEGMLSLLDRKTNGKGRAVFILVSENASSSSSSSSSSENANPIVKRVTQLLTEGKADDVLVYPFRSLELMSRLRNYQQVLMWAEVESLNASYAEMVERLKEDLDLAVRLQKSHAPARFPEVKGFKAFSRYLAGLRSGGDYFDLAENRSGSQLSLILSDSSSYGLSSAVLSVLMRVAMKLSFDETRSCEETVQRIREEILTTLNERDHLSLFYGVISRKDYVMRYLNLGSSRAFYAPPQKPFQLLAPQGNAITRKMLSGPSKGSGSEMVLDPEGRLAILSDGFVEGVGGMEGLMEVLQSHRNRESTDLMNELVFRVKSKGQEGEMPNQDCTAIVLEVDARIIRQI